MGQVLTETRLLSKEALMAFERKMHDRYGTGEIPYLIHLSGGNEDPLLTLFDEIKPEDFVFSTHRSHYHYLLKGARSGVDLRDDLEDKIVSGKSMFVYSRKLNFYCSGICAGTPGLAAGLAWNYKRTGQDRKVWCFIGDGAEDEGHFYEAANFVEGHQLPCTFVIEDNDKSVDTTKAERRGTFNPDWSKHSCVRRFSYTPIYGHYGIGNVAVKYTKEPAIPDMPERQSSIVPASLPCSEPMKFKQAVTQSMEMLARDCGTIFVGYNVRPNAAYGTLTNVPEPQRLETPLAEDLMTRLALGMALDGVKSLVFFERHDFLTNGLDAIVNQADKINDISGGEFSMPVIIRAVAGSTRPMYAGRTHTQNLTEGIRQMVRFPVFEPSNAREMLSAYEFAKHAKGPVMISERKELYDQSSV